MPSSASAHRYGVLSRLNRVIVIAGQMRRGFDVARRVRQVPACLDLLDRDHLDHVADEDGELAGDALGWMSKPDASSHGCISEMPSGRAMGRPSSTALT